MKFTTTILALLGATSLVAATPVSLTSTKSPIKPPCDYDTEVWCHLNLR